MIIDRGGFALLFKAQIYDISQIKLVERIKKTLGYEVICPRAIQEGTIVSKDFYGGEKEILTKIKNSANLTIQRNLKTLNPITSPSTS